MPHVLLAPHPPDDDVELAAAAAARRAQTQRAATALVVGVQPAELADDWHVHRVTAGARSWLGADATAGQEHLRPGRRGRYTPTGVLVDADLFRQLRARAAVRGDDGLPDLLAALERVSGPPFAHRPAGYECLDGLDFTLTAAVCDVATRSSPPSSPTGT
jgi:hypothetical protein